MDVSIIYVNYKTSDLILNSIKSVKEKTKGIFYELIVVDNDSQDNSLELIKNRYPEVICIQSGENLGFGKANNLGLEKAKGDFVFFLNPDTLLKNDAISILYNFLVRNPNVGACGGNLFDEKNNPTTSFGRVYPSFCRGILSIFYIPPLFVRYPKSIFFNYEKNPINVAFIIGADLMIRRSVISSVGGFEPEFFMNYEETELCKRIRGSGFDIYSIPSAEIIHLEGRASYIKQSRLFFLYEGQYIYFRKVYGYKGALLIFYISQLKNYIRIFQFFMLYNKKKRLYWKMKLETNKHVWVLFNKKMNSK